MSAKPSSPRFSAKAQAALGWALALAAVVGGWLSYGGPGVLLALTVIVFWLLLQFSQALRTLRIASQRPVGVVPSAVMLNAKLHAGMRLPQVLRLTLSLGRPVQAESGGTEVWAWADETGDEVQVTLHGGRVTQWQLQRVAARSDT
ncbi:hypothetical protein [Rubrivivax rivuli]|uniref:Glycerate kinase n=1 Tax=Rubrivivax rivuli TaxID=1862385 RepID=A0A437RS67_9BURK|nr:hypothetical protein [Rubrivivax rivuli]RVU49591.1 hypothetical protein EOE66_03265 [Rubrivivax rivuli]